MNLHELKPASGARRSKTRVGRGPGAGKGKTAGRGEKGQKSRSGYSARRGFEGGQMPLHRRLPKRGFHPPFRTTYRTVNVGRLADLEAGSVVTPESLQAAGILRRGSDPVKILGDGELTTALTVQAHRFTKSAAEKIAKAGGTVETIEERPRGRGPKTRKGKPVETGKS